MFDNIRVELDGLTELNNQLNKRFSGEALDELVDRALISGGNVMKKELRKNFETFKDTGASRDEITVSQPMTLNGVRTVVIYWYGENNRWHIIHMNEFGTIKNPNPRGKGAIERSMRSGMKEYFRVIQEEIGDAIL